MARKLLLRTVMLDGGTGNGPQAFSYADMMLTILRNGPPGRGLTLDEVVKALDASKPIEEAAEVGKAEVVLTDDQWATLKQKLDTFAFAYAHRVLAEFGLHIRNAPEIGTAEAAEGVDLGTRHKAPQLAS